MGQGFKGISWGGGLAEDMNMNKYGNIFGNTATTDWSPGGLNTSTNNNNWFSNAFSGSSFGDTLSGLAAVGNTIMGGITGLQSMNLAKKNLGLAKEQFGFQKALANRNLANQAKIINNTYDTAASVAGAQAGKFGMIDQAILDKYAQVAKDKHVSGEAI